MGGHYSLRHRYSKSKMFSPDTGTLATALILISPFPFSGTGEYLHACMSRVLFLSRVFLLEAQQEQTSKLRIFLIKLSHSSSTYENTFAFKHFSDRRRAITFGLKERAILFAYSVKTVLGSSRSSSVTITVNYRDPSCCSITVLGSSRSSSVTITELSRAFLR